MGMIWGMLARMEFKNRLMAWSCVVALSLSGFASANSTAAQSMTGPISYTEIGDRLISSYGTLSGGGTTSQHNADDLVWLSEQESRTLAFRVLNESNRYEVEQHHPCVYEALRNFIKDLELFYANDDRNHAHHLFFQLDRTATKSGQAVLAKMLTSFTADQQLLQKRQAFIELLLNDEQLYQELSDLVQKLKEQENGMLSFWHEEDPTTKGFVESFYYDLIPSFNQNPVALEIGAQGQSFLQLWPSFADIFRNIAVYKIVLGIDPTLGTFTFWQAFKHAVSLSHNPVANAKKMSNFFSGAYEHKFINAGISNETLRKALSNAGGLFYGEATLNACVNSLNKFIDLKTVIKNIKFAKLTIKKMQARLMGVAAGVDAVHQLVQVADAHPQIAQGLITYASKNKIVEAQGDLKHLLTLLETSTFKGNPSYASYNGRVLTAYKLMEDNKADFACVLELLGEVDAYLSIAKLVREFRNQPVNYCLPAYITHTRPMLQFDGFWNPMINPSQVVCNDLVLGGDATARNMILTGSNTGGKSTVLKGIAFNGLLAQTLGIVAADKAVVTPFSFLGISLNIVDNIAGGKSLFQSEIDRAVGLVNAAALFTGKGHCLLVVDELFRGTTPDRAQEQTYEFAQRFASFKNTIYILATHFVDKVTQLEVSTGGECKNYKIEIKRDADGALQRTFKLVEGINTSNVAADILDTAWKK